MLGFLKGLLDSGLRGSAWLYNVVVGGLITGAACILGGTVWMLVLPSEGLAFLIRKLNHQPGVHKQAFMDSFQEERGLVKCPACREWVDREALLCHHCGTQFE